MLRFSFLLFAFFALNVIWDKESYIHPHPWRLLSLPLTHHLSNISICINTLHFICIHVDASKYSLRLWQNTCTCICECVCMSMWKAKEILIKYTTHTTCIHTYKTTYSQADDIRVYLGRNE